MDITRSLRSRGSEVIAPPRRHPGRVAALLAVVALAWVNGPVAAQTAGTAGPAPDVAPAITSPPSAIVSPGTGAVLSGEPNVLNVAPGVGSEGAPSVASGAPSVASGGPPAASVAPSGVVPQVVIPSALPRTGDGSMRDPIEMAATEAAPE